MSSGHEADLRSPLADSLTLAAAEQSDLPHHLLIAGVDLDGELAPPQLRTLLDRYKSTAITELNAEDVSVVAEVWNWHPSEANGLLCAAARAWRGVAETQRDALISITDDATRVYEVHALEVAAHSLAADLSGSPSLELAEQTIRDRRGYSDIDIERQRQATHRKPRMPTPATLDEIDRYTHAASLRGVDALTVRRVIELCGASGAEVGAALRGLLSRRRPDKLRPPLYLV
nr:DUF1152 domain-containing protein [Nocardia brasiliensis]